MKLTFGKAEHRWLSVQLLDTEQELSFFASYTPNNFLLEIVWALDAFLDGQLGTALLYERSITRRFVFFQRDNKGVFRLEEYDDFVSTYDVADMLNIRDKSSVLLQWEDEPEEIVQAFWRGLKNLESRTPTDLTPEHWPWGFPSEQLRRLEAKLKT